MEDVNLGVGIYEIIVIVVVLTVTTWSLAWKGVALWRAARAGQRGWFVALLVINTLGVLEILYLYVLRPRAEPTPGGAAPLGPR
jgi:hypothetical protein